MGDNTIDAPLPGKKGQKLTTTTLDAPAPTAKTPANPHFGPPWVSVSGEIYSVDAPAPAPRR